MKDIPEEMRVREIIIGLTDYEINLMHGLLVDEEIRLKEKIPILLIESGYNFDNTKAYVEEVKRLRRLFTKIDDTEDYLEVFSRIEDYRLDKEAESNHITSNNTVKVISVTGKITNRTATVASGVRPVCNINKEKEVEEMPVTEKIKKWFKDRNLDRADPKSQMLKLMEETGELAEGIAKNRPDQIKDSIGDIYVVLTGLSIQLGYSIEECIEAAYEEIKDRKGKMIDGVFVKESDL